MHYDTYASPIGILYLTGTGGVLTGLSFGEEPPEDAAPGTFPEARQWLDDYFRGQPRPADFPMAPSGTAFQMLIWKLLPEIPWGETRTYGQLAVQAAGLLGREKMSAQAVGQAVGRNPIAIIIPCHRVVGSGGSLTGYAYGLDKKAWLLEHEWNN